VRYPNYVYALHVFKKKSHQGIATPKVEIDLIHSRLAAAEKDYKALPVENPVIGTN